MMQLRKGGEGDRGVVVSVAPRGARRKHRKACLSGMKFLLVTWHAVWVKPPWNESKLCSEADFSLLR